MSKPSNSIDIRRIRELEALSRRLEPQPKERAQVRDAVVGFTECFFERLATAPTYLYDKSSAEALRKMPFGESSVPVEELLSLLDEGMLRPGINPAAPGHLGYIPGGGLAHAAVGDYLAAASNEYAGAAFAGPGSTAIESALIQWMAELAGYGPNAGGTLTSGGSLANLTALVAAREARGFRARDFPRLVVYLTEHTHHCIDKALRVAGLGEAVRRFLPFDDTYRLNPTALLQQIDADRHDNLVPWIVVASAGTTDVGAIDPLETITDIATEQGLWTHVDAAYGGFFLLCPEMRQRFAGIERTDSIVMDPHKGLFLPYGTGAVVLRDGQHLRRAFSYQASYMQDIEVGLPCGETPSSPADMSLELSRHFRGLRMWLPLVLHGLQPFRAALAEKLLLARYVYDRLVFFGFEVGPLPQLTVVPFRWIPESGDANTFNRQLLDEIHRDGRIFLSSTILDGRFVLRFAILNFRSHLEHIDRALEIIKEKVSTLRSHG